jgi:hypothetical protein
MLSLIDEWPEPLVDALGIHAFVDQQRGVRAAQVVEAQARQADAFADLLKPPQDVALFERRAYLG